VLCTTVVHNDTHTREQFLHFCMLFESIFLVCICLDYVFCVFYRVSLGHVVLVLFAFVVLVLVFFSTKPSDWLGRTSLK